MSAVTEPVPAPGAAPEGRSKGVIWTGAVLGTALAILAMTDGVRLKIGGMPPWLGWIAGGFLVWLITVGLAVLAAEMLRRHHRQMRRAAARTGTRAVRSAGRAARHHGRRGVTAAEGWAGSRWARRQAPSDGDSPDTEPDGTGQARTARPQPVWRPRLPRFSRRNTESPDPGQNPPGSPEPGPGPGQDPGPGNGPGPIPGERVRVSPDGRRLPDGMAKPPWTLQVRSRSCQQIDPDTGRSIAAVQVDDIEDLRRRIAAAREDPDLQARWGTAGTFDLNAPWLICVECGQPGSKSRPLTRAPGDTRDDPHAHYIHPSCLPGQDDTPETGGETVTDHDIENHPQQAATGPVFELPRKGYPSRAPGRGGPPAAPDTSASWKALVADTADYEPEDDSGLLAWMDGEKAGMTAYADGIQSAYETAVNSVGLDPAAMAALHDCADAALDAAEKMAAARNRFTQHYEAVREFTGSGGVLPHNGRWMTGDGD